MEAGSAGSSVTSAAGSSPAALVPTTRSAGPTTSAPVSRHSLRHQFLDRRRHRLHCLLHPRTFLHLRPLQLFRRPRDRVSCLDGCTAMKTTAGSNEATCRRGWRRCGVAAVVAAGWAACHSPLRGRSAGGEDARPGWVNDAAADWIDVILVADGGDEVTAPDVVSDAGVDGPADAIGMCQSDWACQRQGTRYCGRIGDGCCGTLECGDCPDGWQCDSPGICVGSPRVCTPVVCKSEAGQYCGSIGDGCGRTLDCGTCADAGWECIDHVCVGPASVCKPYTCENCPIICGKVGDGCGRALECERTCLLDQYCRDGVCYSSKPDCEPMQVCIAASGDHYCGVIGNGCWQELPCGDDCPVGRSCVDHTCVGSPPGCVPLPCNSSLGQLCGTVGDGCGGTLECGLCPDSQECGTDHVCVGLPPEQPRPAPPPPPPPPPPRTAPPLFLPSPPAAPEPPLPPPPSPCLLP